MAAGGLPFSRERDATKNSAPFFEECGQALDAAVDGLLAGARAGRTMALSAKQIARVSHRTVCRESKDKCQARGSIGTQVLQEARESRKSALGRRGGSRGDTTGQNRHVSDRGVPRCGVRETLMLVIE